MNPKDNESNMQNGTWGTPGTNKTWDKVQGNRGKQIQEARERGWSK